MIRSVCLKDYSDFPVENRLNEGKRAGKESSTMAKIQRRVNEAA